MNPTYASALGTAGTAGGIGLAQILGGLSDVLSAPRKMAWNAAGLGETGSDFVQNVFGGGIDPESMTGGIVGNAAEMLLDPVNLLGPLAGAAGRAVGTGLDVSKAAAATRGSLAKELALLAGEKGAMGEVGSIAKGVAEAPGAMANWPSPMSGLWKSTTPELEALKGPAQGVAFPTIAKQKVFNRASPEAVGALEHAGMGSQVQGGKRGVIMTMDEKPNFIAGKGGTMQLDPTRFVPEYGASFGTPPNVASMFGPGEDRLASLTSRLGESADLLHAPLGDVEGQLTKRLAMMGLDETALQGALTAANDIKTPFNLSANPRVSEHLAKALAQMQAGGVSAAMIPGLFRAPAPVNRPAWPPTQTDEPPLLQQFAPPEQLRVMPQQFVPTVNR